MNIYSHNNQFNDSKYTKWYYSIIENAIKQERIKTKQYYFENHHILPKSIFSEYKKEIWNIVFLTAKEHFIAHCLLVKMTSGKNQYKMANVMRFLKTSKKHLNRYVNSNLYNLLKKYNVAWNKNIPRTPEQKLRHSQIMKGRPSNRKGKKHTEEAKKKNSKAHKGKKHFNRPSISIEHRKSVSEANKKRKGTKYKSKIINFLP